MQFSNVYVGRVRAAPMGYGDITISYSYPSRDNNWCLSRIDFKELWQPVWISTAHVMLERLCYLYLWYECQTVQIP